jgi:hypothetical protein
MSRACSLYLRAAVLAWTIGLVLFLMAGCGGGDDHDPDAELREWCLTFVGPLTPERQAECDRVLGRKP